MHSKVFSCGMEEGIIHKPRTAIHHDFLRICVNVQTSKLNTLKQMNCMGCELNLNTAANRKSNKQTNNTLRKRFLSPKT